MCKISEGICLLIMLILSVFDLRIRKVPVCVLAAAGAAGIIYQVTFHHLNWWLFAGGGLVGVIFLFISKLTCEGIGYGDSFGILALGLYLGIWSLLAVLGISFFLLLCVLFSSKLFSVKSKRKIMKNWTIPFYPFLTGGYLGILMAGGMYV